MAEMTQDLNVTAEKPARRIGLGSIFLMLSIIAAGVIVGLQLMNSGHDQPTAGPAPDFEFTTFEGETFQLSDFRGQVVMLNFWASWCAPCRAEAVALQNSWEHYQGQGVVFIGIAYADNGPRSEAYLEEFGVTYLNAPDLGTRISEDYNIQGVPESFIIDRDGNIAQFIYAGVTEQSLGVVLDRVLAEG